MTDAPAPSPEPWSPPDGDQDFVFTTIQEAPAWVDRTWASFDHGPALAVPAGDVAFGSGPYTTKIAHPGDTVKFVAAKGAVPAHMEVIPGAPEGESVTRRIPQATNASLEDMLKVGTMAPDDLGDDAKAQVAQRTPAMKRLVEEGKGAPEAQSAEDAGLKTS